MAAAGSDSKAAKRIQAISTQLTSAPLSAATANVHPTSIGGSGGSDLKSFQAAEQQKWTAVDQYFVDRLQPKADSDPALSYALSNSTAQGLPPANVSPAQGELLSLLAKSCGAKSVLEVGTLGGYSTIWLARAVGEAGRVHTLEIDPKHAKIAQEHIDRAGLTNRVTIHVGEALKTLHAKDDSPGWHNKFDFVFIDADKKSNLDYLRYALMFTAKPALIVIDNVVRNGAVTDSTSTDVSVKGVQTVTDWLKENAASCGIESTAVQTVGSKGYDGFILARVKALNEK